jgi:hypothetical protein
LITAKNEVRGWDLYTTTELYKSLAKNKLKTKKLIMPAVDKVYSSNYGFNKIIKKDMNKKEEALKNEIKYYKEHRDQINRIMRLENELAHIKNSINAVHICYE